MTSCFEAPVREELRLREERLKPAPLYRVAWRVRPDDETPFRWEEGEER